LGMPTPQLSKRLTLRATLRAVSPMIIRVLSVSDQLDFPEFHEAFQGVLGWSGHLGFIVRIHGQEFNSFRRRTRTKRLCDFQLHRQEKFLYTCDAMHGWEWDLRVLDIEDAPGAGDATACVAGRGASPPEYCGGPTGYRLMLKRQREGAVLSDPARFEVAVGWLAATHPDEPAERWDFVRDVLRKGWESVDRRLEQYGPLDPERFSLQEANARLAFLAQRGYWS
jgi:hypothetical protein